MNAATAKLLVSVTDNAVWIRICGRANFNSSIDFKTLVNELREKGYQRFVLDLSECVLMDSTFLGVLAGLGLKVNAADLPGESPVELLNPNARIAELLENLGVLHLFKISCNAIRPPDSAESRDAGANAHSKQAIAETSLEAHRTLMDISPANIAKFKDVAEFLAEDLKRLKTTP